LSLIAIILEYAFRNFAISWDERLVTDLRMFK
jgi:hypothetical protein